jgi:hypothetical protein
MLLAVVVAVAAGGAYYTFRPNPPLPAPADPAPADPAPAPVPSVPVPAAFLLVDPRPPGLLPGGTALTPDEIETYRKTLVALVKNDDVANVALRDPLVRELEVVRKEPDAAAWLAAHLTAEYPAGGSILRITVSGVSPREAALLANAVARAYLREVVQKDSEAQMRRCHTLENAYVELINALDTRREQLHKLASESGVPPNPVDHRALVASLYQERTGLRLELARVRAERDTCAEPGAREKRLRDELATLDARIKSCEQANLDPARAEVVRLESALTSVASELTRMRVDMNSPSRVLLLALAPVR